MFLYSEKYLLLHLKDPSTRDKAFAVVIKQYKEKIYWYVRRMVIDFDDAKDVTQDVFIKAWEGLDHFQCQSDIYTWLYRIATNESLNHLRKKNKYLNISLEQGGEYLLRALDNEDHLMSGEVIAMKLDRAIALLPEKQRAVFILRYFEERDYKEIAEITGTSEGALHASFHHAIRKIEKKLKDD